MIGLNISLFADEQNDVLQLEQVLQEATEIATKTRLNADYVPGNVTIVTGDTLKKLGITNLNQPNAFSIIAGMNSPVFSLRGTGAVNGVLGNKIKWLLNGQPIENELLGFAFGTYKFSIPVDFVSRVEVLRGPDSAIYGDKAVSGVVNIVTKESSLVYTDLGAYADHRYSQELGVMQNFHYNDWSFNLALSAQNDDNSKLDISKEGNFYNASGIYQPGYGPGTIPNSYTSKTFLLDIKKNDLKAWLYYINTVSGQGSFGQWLPSDPLPSNDGRYKTDEKYTILGISNTFHITDDLSLTPKVGLTIFEANENKFKGTSSELSGMPANVDQVAQINYKEVQKSFATDFEWQFDKHTINGGISFLEIQNVDDSVYRNYKPTPGTFVYAYPYALAEGIKKYNRAEFIQDTFDATDKVTITAGARYDYFNDMANKSSSATSPRLAVVYRYDGENIFKAQVARSFRSPTLGETGWNPSPLQSEIDDTAEVSYIFKTDHQEFKTTGFVTKAYNMITQDSMTYDVINVNTPITTHGIEFEYNFSNEIVNIISNLAYYRTYMKPYDFISPSDGKLYHTDNSMSALTPSILANLAVTLQPATNHPTTVWFNYVGDSRRMIYPDTINGVSSGLSSDAYTTAQNFVNVTQTVKGLVTNLELNFGVRDIFNQTLTTDYKPLGITNTNDVPYAKRSFWISAAYKF